MFINVAQLLKEPIDAKRVYSLEALVDKDNEYALRGNVTLTRTNQSILVSGEISAIIRGICARCLKDTSVPLKFNIEDEFYPMTDIISGKHLHTDPDDFVIDSDNILDLGEAIEQYIILMAPTKLLCRPDCLGIFPSYGQEPSRNGSQNQSKAIDSRLEKLEQLRKESRVKNGTTS